MSPTRDRLLQAIRDRPGLHKSALCAEAGLAWGTVDYHLRVLARKGLVTTHQAGRETRCFPGELAAGQKALLAALADGTGSRIAFVLRHCPGQGVAELSERLGLSSKVVRLRLLRMVADGMLERVGKHRPRYSFGSEVHRLFEEVAPGTPGTQPAATPATPVVTPPTPVVP